MQRNQSLDALRGFAILAMVLSSSIAFGILPGWMYHAQVPPPGHVYDPTLPGITWVDLVFPFFLFSMGAAFPLAFQRRIEAGEPGWKLAQAILQRFLLLVFFAIFTMHARAWVQSTAPGWQEHLLAIGCFVLLCLLFTQWNKERNVWLQRTVKGAAWLLAFAFLFLLPFADGKGFKLHRSDIIIIVLANMALFGSFIWLATRNHPWLRLGILPFVMAVFLASKVEGSWNAALYQWTPFDWMYKFYYLKYLFIIIPGTLAGEWLAASMKSKTSQIPFHRNKLIAVVVLAVAVIVANVIFLYLRWTVLNLFVSAILVLLLLYTQRRDKENKGWSFYNKMIQAGTFLLLLGLFFEAYEGGIKKDPSTYSYYFVTAGLSFFALLVFDGLERLGFLKAITRYLALNGKNPMVAYVTGNLLLLPLLHLSGGIQLLKEMETNIWLGVLRGFLFTGVVSLVTIWFTQKKWFWKT